MKGALQRMRAPAGAQLDYDTLFSMLEVVRRAITRLADQEKK